VLTGAASIALATLAWLVFAYSPNSIVRTAQAPVDVRNVPEDWILERVEPVAVALSLSGPERAFDALDEDSLAVTIGFDRLQEGTNSMTIGMVDVELPPRLQLRSAEPATVVVVARQLVAAEVPVEVPLLGALPSDLVLVGVQPQPASVTLYVRPGEDPPQRVLTQPLDLRTIDSSREVSRALSLPAAARLGPEQQADIAVSVEVRTRE
jgi:hypothetical protein